MRVLIIRPEREATTLATALAERGHTPVIAPLFRLEFLHPPAEFSAALADCQAVLLTSANGARALAEASEQRGRRDPGGGRHHGQHRRRAGLQRRHLGRGRWRGAGRAGAAAPRAQGRSLAARIGPRGCGRSRRTAAAGRLRGEAASRSTTRARRPLLPDSARAALEARALDVVTFFSPRAASVFASMVEDAGLTANLRERHRRRHQPGGARTGGGPAVQGGGGGKAAQPAGRARRDRPTGRSPCTRTGDHERHTLPLPTSRPDPPPAQPIIVRRGLGVVGAFVVGVLAAVIVLAGALISLPFWPQQARDLWRGQAAAPTPPTPGIDLQAVRADATAVANAAVDYGAQGADGATGRSREAPARRLGDGGRAANGARRSRSRDRRLEEPRRSAGAAPRRQRRSPDTGPPCAKQRRGRKRDRRADARDRGPAHHARRARPGRRQPARPGQGAERRRRCARNTGEQKAMTAARASAVIGVGGAARAARSMPACRSRPSSIFWRRWPRATPSSARSSPPCSPMRRPAWPRAPRSTTQFPAVAKAALAEDVADDSYGERLMGKLRGLVSLRRVGDVPGDTTEAKLARAEQALACRRHRQGGRAGEVAAAADQQGDGGLARQAPTPISRPSAASDQIAAHAVNLLGAARRSGSA